ncbi:unnamed protein product [Ixodes persulcatus]
MKLAAVAVLLCALAHCVLGADLDVPTTVPTSLDEASVPSVPQKNTTIVEPPATTPNGTTVAPPVPTTNGTTVLPRCPPPTGRRWLPRRPPPTGRRRPRPPRRCLRQPPRASCPSGTLTPSASSGASSCPWVAWPSSTWASSSTRHAQSATTTRSEPAPARPPGPPPAGSAEVGPVFWGRLPVLLRDVPGTSDRRQVRELAGLGRAGCRVLPTGPSLCGTTASPLRRNPRRSVAVARPARRRVGRGLVVGQ